MLIIGAGGFAKEVFETISLVENDQIAFYDDIAQDRGELFGKKIITYGG
jgi:hypothetical protein